jgi:hypothetical protein
MSQPASTMRPQDLEALKLVIESLINTLKQPEKILHTSQMLNGITNQAEAVAALQEIIPNPQALAPILGPLLLITENIDKLLQTVSQTINKIIQQRLETESAQQPAMPFAETLSFPDILEFISYEKQNPGLAKNPEMLIPRKLDNIFLTQKDIEADAYNKTKGPSELL